MQKQLKEYKKTLMELKRLEGISALLEWDQENQMPAKSIKSRSETSALIAKITHEKSTNKQFGDLINELYENSDKLDPVEKRSIEVTKKNYDKVVKLPTEFVEEFSKLRSLAQSAWVEAKAKENYLHFEPYLKKIIKFSRDYARYIDKKKPIYDVLLDDYEEGMTTTKLQEVFSDLKIELIELLSKIPTKENKKSLSSQVFDKDITRKFLLEMTKQIGFDYERGALGEVHHPFETSITEDDIRINVSYPEKYLAYSITAAIHEAGHGLYEQNVDKKYHETALGHGVSLGIHESQSRLLENMIGRSEAFWKFFLPKLKKYYPSLDKIKVEDVVGDLNRVTSSFIRTEADEVTYNMHIILRFELELLLLDEELSTKDLPEEWDKMMHELLGIKPKKISKGVLQDVHWSIGAVGYFPTYALGNLNAGQLWNKFISENKKWESEVAKGDFTSYFNWFKENIWRHGGYYKPRDLMIKATGEDLNAKYFVEYLNKKYLG